MGNSNCHASLLMIEKAKKDETITIWDRFEQQNPQCSYGLLGICCRNCNMGPCRIDPFGNSPQKGVCGATADIIVARNLLAQIAAGAAAHSDHGRDILLHLRNRCGSDAANFRIVDNEKLIRIATEAGIFTMTKNSAENCIQLTDYLLNEFGKQIPTDSFLLNRVPAKRLNLWREMNIVPRGIDREIVESMHRTHMGVDNDSFSMLKQGMRTAIADGWIGSMIATEISDIMYGVPKPKITHVNLGVIKENMVNIVIHGHEPLLSEMIIHVSNNETLLQKAKENGADGINICGMCCTGNEMLLRHGVKLAGNFLQQELAIITGAVEAMVVDIQCILPSLGDIAKCYHTKFISTSPKAHFPEAIAMESDEHTAYKTAFDIVNTAIDNYRNRIKAAVSIPGESMISIAGFSNESLQELFGPGYELLIEAIKNRHIRGIAAVVGCNNPKVKHDFNHTVICRELLKHDILILTTGCSAIACAKAGLLHTDALVASGNGLKCVCSKFGIPPVLHMGSCVDISRILLVTAKLAAALETDISDLPLAAAAPEWMSQKALSIGTYLVASGILTVLGTIPPVLGSQGVSNVLLHTIENLLNARFAVESDPFKAAQLMINHINNKRKILFDTDSIGKVYA